MLTALGFLTALPLPRREFTAAQLARSLIFFPLVGLLIGGLLLGLDWLLALVLPPEVRAALLIAALLGLTRALHVDGLIDCCDGLFGGFTPARRLEILRDSRVGAFGVLGAGVWFLSRYSLFTVIDEPWRLVGLLLPPVLGRWAITLAIVAFPYARSVGMGAAFKEAAQWWQVGLATLLALAVCAACIWPWGGLGLIIAALVTGGVAQFCRRRLGGLTGDCYGAINEVVEVTILLGIVAIQTLSRGN